MRDWFYQVTHTNTRIRAHCTLCFLPSAQGRLFVNRFMLLVAFLIFVLMNAALLTHSTYRIPSCMAGYVSQFRSAK